MGSSSADVLRSLDLASCAAELAVGSLEPPESQQLPKVYNPMPEPAAHSRQGSQQPQDAHSDQSTENNTREGVNGVLLPRGHLVMKLLQV